MTSIITWQFIDPTPDQLQEASDLADHLSEAAFTEDIKTARENTLSIVELLWPKAS